jgi:hypothetical protein
MISVRTVAVVAGLGAATLLACACNRVTHADETPPARVMDLVVLVDVSTSMTPEDLETGVTAVYKFVREQLPANSSFQMYIADRDMVVNELARLVKGEANFLGEQMALEKTLRESRAAASKRLREYLLKFTERRETCLVKALTDSPGLFGPAAPHIERTIVIVGDMNEDCSPLAEPRTEEELREQLTRSLETFRPERLEGIELIGVVPMSQRPIRVKSSERLWRDALKDAKLRGVSIITQSQFVSTPASTASGPS